MDIFDIEIDERDLPTEDPDCGYTTSRSEREKYFPSKSDINFIDDKISIRSASGVINPHNPSVIFNGFNLENYSRFHTIGEA